MRFVIYGAGAVGGTIGARLFEAGENVTLIARGDHAKAIAERGLRLDSPDGSATSRIPVVEHPRSLDIGDDVVVVLAMKSQHTVAALDDLGPQVAGVALVCAQNGVENERLCLRRTPDVHGMCVMLPSAHLEPGVVEVYSSPVPGILDVGRYPSGADARTEAIASALTGAGFVSEARADIMRWKHAKLLMNLGNALEAACGPAARASDLGHRAANEAVACFAAAGIAYVSAEEDAARRGDLMRLRPIDGRRRGGGSSWQSLAGGKGNIEADSLNGEIVLLGRLHGVPTPVNEALRRVANRLAAEGAPPGSMTVEQLEAEVATEA